ncbi:MAG: hydrogenase iron-sulfur subunit, partial [bacterium]|nr:hydrogenase iron-sulfur subunit [bacterium]
MTDRKRIYNDDLSEIGLAEFESDSVVTLVEFENESALLLDEFSPDVLGMLDEFNTVLETIHEDGLGETVNNDPDSSESENAEESDPDDVEEEKDEEKKPEPVISDADLIKPEPVIFRPEPVPDPLNPVIGFVCEHAMDISKMTGPRGRMKDRRMVFLVSVPCSAMVKPSWLGYSLAKGASGVFIVTCSPDLCHHRTGAAINERRLNRQQKPVLADDIDMNRVRLFNGHPAGKTEFFNDLDKFLREIAVLDQAERALEEGKIGKDIK